METLYNDFAETEAGNAVLEIYQSDFDLHDFGSAGPGDEEEGEDENSEDEGNDNSGNEGSDDNDPPLDEDVVHSPVPTKSGGTPNT